MGEEVCNGSTLKTLGTFTSSEDSRGAIATTLTSPIVDLAGLTVSLVIVNVGATLLDATDSGLRIFQMHAYLLFVDSIHQLLLSLLV